MHELINDSKNEREDKVRGRACRCNDHHVALRISEIAWIDLHRFCPTEARDKQKNGAYRVEMSKWIQRQPTLISGSRIAKPISRKGVSKLMQRQCEENRRSADEQLQVEFHYDEITFLRSLFVRSSSAQSNQPRVFINYIPLMNEHLIHNAIVWGFDFIFHLHRFDGQ